MVSGPQLAFTSTSSGQIGIPASLASYCDAPRISAAQYTPPKYGDEYRDVKLVHVIHVQRHHKRTPDNLIPNDEALFNSEKGWHCDDVDLFDVAAGARGAVSIRRLYRNSVWSPLHNRIWNGTCEAGQVTSQGLADSVVHGQDLASVYGRDGVNPLLNTSNIGLEAEVVLRTSPEERTRHVASSLLRGLGYPLGHSFPAVVMPRAVDGIVPSYSCAYANRLRDEVEYEPTWRDHLAGQKELFDKVNGVLGTQKYSEWTSWIDHAFDALSSRQCHGHALPRNPHSGQAITQELADRVYAEGEWEYNYIYNASPQADALVRYSFAVFVQELVVLLGEIQARRLQHKLTLLVGHDGTMARLLKILGQPYIPWPGMGSEVQIEVYEAIGAAKRATHDCTWPHDRRLFVRILAGGKTLVTISEGLRGGNYQHMAEWVPLESVLEFLKSRIPSDIRQRCADD